MKVDQRQIEHLGDLTGAPSLFAGHLVKRGESNNKWQDRFFALRAGNLLFYYPREDAAPLGVVFLEQCVVAPMDRPSNAPEALSNHFFFSVGTPGQRLYELATPTEETRTQWMRVINTLGRCSAIRSQVDTLRMSLEASRKALGEYEAENHALRRELDNLQQQHSKGGSVRRELAAAPEVDLVDDPVNTAEGGEAVSTAAVRVQSLMRMWLYRRRWAAIVRDYVSSPHASVLKTRNRIISEMVEDEESYLDSLNALVHGFMRPLQLTADSSRPCIDHGKIRAIFLNVETLLFAHQLFYGGLQERLARWPRVELGDQFQLLVPIVAAYNDLIRNLQNSFKVLAQCRKAPGTGAQLNMVLERCQAKNRGFTLETLLVAPVHQFPRYVAHLRNLVLHTPNDHVEADKLSAALARLEEVSDSILERTSEAENSRLLMTIERRFADGCPVLLDPDLSYVREGPLSLVQADTHAEKPVHCFLVTNFLIIATGGASGEGLKLAKDIGVVPLADVKISEEDLPAPPVEESAPMSYTVLGVTVSVSKNAVGIAGSPWHLIRLAWSDSMGQDHAILLRVVNQRDRASWISDLMQSMDLAQQMRDSRSAVVYDPKDYEDLPDIRFGSVHPDGKGPVPVLRFASVDRIIERLTHPKASVVVPIDTLNTFLLTYRSFTSGVYVLEALIKRFETGDAEVAIRQANAAGRCPPVRLRVLNLIKHWVTKHYHDFHEDRHLMEALSGFLATILETHNNLELPVSSLQKSIRSAQQLQQQGGISPIGSMFRDNLPIPAVDVCSVAFADINPTKLAQQLTLVDHEIFSSIHLKELLNQAWAKKDKASRSPNVMLFIQRFNEISEWVAYEIIVNGDGMKGRATFISKFIEIADACRVLNNYNCVMGILAGLGNSAVYRLKQSWLRVPSQYRKTFNDLKALMATTGSFDAYRQALHRSDPPAVPYLGVYLTDLTFTDDGNPDMSAVDGAPDKLVNFSKMRMVAHIMREIKQYQQAPYSVAPDPDLLAFLLMAKSKTAALAEGDDDLYDISLRIEPRELVRDKSVTGTAWIDRAVTSASLWNVRAMRAWQQSSQSLLEKTEK